MYNMHMLHITPTQLLLASVRNAYAMCNMKFKSQRYLHIAYCILQIAYCILHIAYCILHIAYYLSPSSCSGSALPCVTSASVWRVGVGVATGRVRERHSDRHSDRQGQAGANTDTPARIPARLETRTHINTQTRFRTRAHTHTPPTHTPA